MERPFQSIEESPEFEAFEAYLECLECLEEETSEEGDSKPTPGSGNNPFHHT